MLKKYWVIERKNEWKEGRKEGRKEEKRKGGREEEKGRRMGGSSHDDFGIWSTPSPVMWNWIKETSFEMEPGGQKGQLPHTTTPVRDPNRKRSTLHSQQQVSLLYHPSRRKKDFSSPSNKPSQWEPLQVSQWEAITILNSRFLQWTFVQTPIPTFLFCL